MTQPWEVGAALAPDVFAGIRRRMIFDYCKWDPQVGDTAILAPFALILDDAEWRRVAATAARLAAETLDAETELLRRPDLHAELGLPPPIGRALRPVPSIPPSRGIARLMRFDFHFTPEGWRISEVNSDVPGGFNEGSGFSRLMAPHYPGTRPPGDPTERLAEALAAGARPGESIALVHATAFTDDRQVMAYLAARLEARGLRPRFVAPDHLRWQDGRAILHGDGLLGPAAVLARFFPGEWLPNLPSRCPWARFLTGSLTPISNPATALLTQSKRFPLVWSRLDTPLPAWSATLPETRETRDSLVADNGAWVFKPAFGRVGEDVAIRGALPEPEWRRLARAARRHPRHWVAQRRFQALAVDVEGSPHFPCLGVYTVDREVAGAYGRIAAVPLINSIARDVAVLIRGGTP